MKIIRGEETFPQENHTDSTSQSIVPVNLLAWLPHHTPHREARICQTEKTLHALMLETQLVKKLLVVSPTPANQHQGEHHK